MIALLRVPTAKFKYNMRPYIERAKAGEEVIVTCGGQDSFRIVPVIQQKPGRLKIGLPQSLEDENEPAFHPLNADEPLA